MEDGAIDFKLLLKEEKKKARQKVRTEQHIHPNSHHEEKWQETTSQNFAVQEEDIEAIDFAKLHQQERSRAVARQRERVAQQIENEQQQEIAQQWKFPTKFSRADCLVCSNPPSIYYVQQFFPNTDDQTSLMEYLQSLPENSAGYSTEQEANTNYVWTTLQYAKRRVAVFDATACGTVSPAMQRLADIFVQQGIFDPDEPPNHVLVNEYYRGQGILPHTDGPAYASRTATLSLGSSVLIQYTPRPNYKPSITGTANTPQNVELLLEPGSLVVFEDAAYLDYCHGIDDQVGMEVASKDCVNANPGTLVTRGYRISLTFRHKYRKINLSAENI